MSKKYPIILFLFLIVFQTYSIAFFYQSSSELDALDLTNESYSGLYFMLGSIKFNVYEIVMFFVIIILFFNSYRYRNLLHDEFIIRLIFYYSIYQVLIISPFSFAIYSLSPMEIMRALAVRLSVLLIPFLFYFVFPLYRRLNKLIALINISSFVLVLAGVFNYFNENVFITNTDQFRLLWGGSALIFALTFLDSFFSKKKSLLTYVFLFISVLGILFVNHRSAYVYLILVFLLGIILNSKGRNTSLLFSLFFLALILTVLNSLDLFQLSFLKRFESTTMSDDNASDRLKKWYLAFDYFLQNPINGSMFKGQYYADNFKYLYPPHSFIFETLATQGLFGLSFYLVLLIKTLRIAYKNRKDEVTFKMFHVLLFYILYSTFNVTFLNVWVVSIMMFSIAIILYRDKKIKYINRYRQKLVISQLKTEKKLQD